MESQVIFTEAGYPTTYSALDHSTPNQHGCSRRVLFVSPLAPPRHILPPHQLSALPHESPYPSFGDPDYKECCCLTTCVNTCTMKQVLVRAPGMRLHNLPFRENGAPSLSLRSCPELLLSGVASKLDSGLIKSFFSPQGGRVHMRPERDAHDVVVYPFFVVACRPEIPTRSLGTMH